MSLLRQRQQPQQQKQREEESPSHDTSSKQQLPTPPPIATTSLSTIIFIVIIKCIGLLILLFQYLMGNLFIEAIEMKHMDPTDIVLVPFDLKRLIKFVVVVSCFGLILADNIVVMRRMFWSSGRSRKPAALQLTLFYYWIQSTCVFWFISIICGTPPTQHIYHTLLACTYLSTLTVLVIPTTTTSSSSSSSFWLWWKSRLILPPSINTNQKSSSASSNNANNFNQQFLAVIQIHATLFTTIPFLILRLYDWGSQIQRWPLPVILGCTYGYVIGSVIGCVCLVFLQYSTRVQEWYELWITATSYHQHRQHEHPK